MSVAVFPLGPLETNCYLVSYEGQAVAIDVGGDPAPVSKYLKEHGLELKAICITHMHFDHLYGVAALAAETHATVYTPEKDKVIASTVLGHRHHTGRDDVYALQQRIPRNTPGVARPFHLVALRNIFHAFTLSR